MTSNVVFKYGDYSFSPKPLFSISSTPLKTPDGIGYGVSHSIDVNGSIITTGTETASGIAGVFQKIEALKDAINQDGHLLDISCGGDVILSGYPTISDWNIEPRGDNYTSMADYTISFEMPTTILGTGNDSFNGATSPPFIESCSETWDVEFADDRTPFDWTLEGGTAEKFGYKVAVSHSVNVQGRISYTGDALPNIPWQDARDYAITKLGFDNDFVTLTGILGLPGGTYFSQFDTFNNYRQVSTDKTGGSVSVTETFIVTPSGVSGLPNNAIETFDISTAQDGGIVTVSIDGEIEGLATISYNGDGGSNVGYIVTNGKFSAASGYYNIVKDRMFDRARTAYSGISDAYFNRALNPTIKSRTVGMNPVEGMISYSYNFDTQTSGCITGDYILSQHVTINDSLPTDIFASHVVPGKSTGPVLQDIGTITARTRSVNIELITLPPTDCSTVSGIYLPVPTGQIEAFIATISGDLIANYSQVFVSSQSQNWDFMLGSYTKSIEFTYNNC